MKKINLLLLFVGIVGMTFITSCNPESKEESALPTISFSSDGISADATDLELSDPVLFKLHLDQSIDTKKNIKTLTVKSQIDGDSINIDTTYTINKDNSLLSLNYYTQPTYSTAEKFVFTIEDKAGVTATKSITLTTKAEPIIPTGDPINTYTSLLLGAQSSTTGSYLDANTGLVYNQSNANSNPTAIDMIYYFGNVALSTIASPTDPAVNAGGFVNLAGGISPQNSTLFQVSSSTEAEFDAMTTDLDFPTSIGSDTKSSNLSQGSVIEFLTADAKFGLFKVVSIATGSAGSMTIEVKIQQ